LSSDNCGAGNSNSTKLQSRQTTIFGNAQTWGLFKPSKPGKWIAISALKFFRSSDEQRLQFIGDPLALAVDTLPKKIDLLGMREYEVRE